MLETNYFTLNARKTRDTKNTKDCKDTKDTKDYNYSTEGTLEKK